MPKTLVSVASCLLLALAGAAQVSPASPVAPQASADAPGFSSLLPGVQQTASTLHGHLAQMDFSHWKANSSLRRDAENNARALDRNLTEALPGMVGQVRDAPSDLAAGFKLYRDLNALYDVLSSLSQSANAFAPAEESSLLTDDANQLDKLRRSFADQLEKAATAQQAQMAQLQNQIRSLTAAQAALPPKRIVVDDDQPVPKPAKKKKTTAAKPKNPQGNP